MPISPTELYDLVRDPNAERTAASARRAENGVLA
jgi:carbon-monoxide dehydrogenase large subunit